jgi:hypothetical protein
MKKYFVIIQQDIEDYYSSIQHIVAIRNCSDEEIKAEVDNLNSSLIDDSHSFYFREAPIDGFSSDFKLQFKDAKLQFASYKNNIKHDILVAIEFLGVNGIPESKLKEVFMSSGRVMDIYFNTGLSKQCVSDMFDEFMSGTTVQALLEK